MHIQWRNVLPLAGWGHRYHRILFKADLTAGLTVAVVAVPQSMAYALIAGLPVQYGLYASIFPTLVGCLWGSSAHLITGPTTAVSLVVFSALTRLATPGTAEYIELALALTFMVGLIQLVMGFARLGNLLNYISHSVILGFSAGAAVLIGFNQLPSLLGLNFKKSPHFYETLVRVATHLDQVHGITLGLGLITLGIILFFKKFRPAWPGTLAAMIFVGLLVALFDLDKRGVAVVGAIPRRLPPFHWPGVSSAVQLGELVSGALAIAILGLVEAVSIAKTIASQTRQRLNVNREFIAQGLANLSAAFFSGYAGSGSFTRSAVNFKSGGKTPVSGVVSAGAVALMVLLAAPLAAQLPLSALAGVLLVVSYEMIRKADIKRAVRATRSDAAVVAVTFFSTLWINIEFAVYVGALLSIALHLAKTAHPRIQSVVPDLKTGKMVPSALGPQCCQMDILQVEGSLFFGSATYVQEELRFRLAHHPDIGNLLIRMQKVNVMDASGVHVMEIVLEDIRNRGGGLYFSGANSRVFEVFKNSGLLKEIGETHFRVTTGSAIRQAMWESFCPAICAACAVIVFNECPELKKGNWDIFGKPGRSPKIGRLSRDPACRIQQRIQEKSTKNQIVGQRNER